MQAKLRGDLGQRAAMQNTRLDPKCSDPKCSQMLMGSFIARTPPFQEFCNRIRLGADTGEP